MTSMLRVMKLLPLLWLCASCATGASTSKAGRAPEAHADRCVSAAQASVSAALLSRLGGASNLIEYENIWRAEHAGASTGNIGASEVRARIHAKLPEIQACYESAVVRSPGGRSRVVVRFVVDAGGRVAAANLATDGFGAPEISCCVVRRVAQWSFAPVAGDFVAVEYPFSVRVEH